jgi:hypothetical protein
MGQQVGHQELLGSFEFHFVEDNVMNCPKKWVKIGKLGIDAYLMIIKL